MFLRNSDIALMVLRFLSDSFLEEGQGKNLGGGK